MNLIMAALIIFPVYMLFPICANAQNLIEHVQQIGKNIEILQDLRREQDQRIQTLEATITRLSNKVDLLEKQETQRVPRDAVVAFYSPNECPPGWSLFPDAVGRFIVGAGEGHGLTKRGFSMRGGKEKHTLTERELPEITTEGWRSDLTVDVFPSSETGHVLGQRTPDRPRVDIRISGEGEAIDNMPPFIALYFCKKD